MAVPLWFPTIQEVDTGPLAAAAAAALTGILGEYLGINFFVVPSLLTHIPQ